MNRRTFLSWVGVGGLASFLPVAIAACSPETETPVSQSSPTNKFQSVGTVAELEQNGQINKKLAGTPLLVIRNPTAPDSLLAVNPTCTHAGCEVNWNPDQKAFACPCHGSKFAPDGKVLEGPANEPLTAYQAKVEGDSVVVNAG
ncbi:MAG: ubiquinol-cytochrome c reductase iron-sulfur subunit [Kastovskya adunca ATA6-11-RM4]|jgi:cytochrome b6-f complex iron-sulfur subunit|nr:ubiquinol-cytochrome c reductase iron-sulfur subunit [Kastovskya adunca ATA6-11-RM4]